MTVPVWIRFSLTLQRILPRTRWKCILTKMPNLPIRCRSISIFPKGWLVTAKRSRWNTCQWIKRLAHLRKRRPKMWKMLLLQSMVTPLRSPALITLKMLWLWRTMSTPAASWWCPSPLSWTRRRAGIREVPIPRTILPKTRLACTIRTSRVRSKITSLLCLIRARR